MAILSIILAILQLLPELITVIKDIVAIFQGHPLGAEFHPEFPAFVAIIQRLKGGQDPTAKADLLAFHAKLVGAPAPTSPAPAAA